MKKSKTLRKKAAFTLAETLIAIGLIGVVAALTIPNLITNYQKKQTAIRLKDTYAILTNAVRLAEKDYDSVSGWDFSMQPDKVVETYLLPYIKYTKKTVDSRKYSYVVRSGEHHIGYVSNTSNAGLITLLNGVQLIYSPLVNLGTAIPFVIDMNGVDIGPNMFGKDAFYIRITNDCGVQFYKDDNNVKTACDPTTRAKLLTSCKKDGDGMWCGELIRQDGWTISKDYPW
jgi:type II secretory pathway pseudopilin PulG